MSVEGLAALRLPTRPGVVLRLLGSLLGVLAAALLVPAAFALFTEGPRAAWPTAAAALALAALGLPTRRLSEPEDVRAHEALVVVALAFVIASLAMWGPFVAAGLPPVDALFESISAITTTGLTTLDSVEGRPVGFLFARAWMQWLGGLGIAVLSVALVLGPGVAAQRLGSVAIEERQPMASARGRARDLLGAYLALTIAACLAIRIGGAGGLDALLYALAAVSTGGFAPQDASVAALPAWSAQAAVLGATLLGAMPLAVWVQAWRRGPGALHRDIEVRALLAIVLALAAALTLARGLQTGDWAAAVRQAPLLAASSQTTAGFQPLAVDALDPGSRLLLVFSMGVGGGLGSTAGGLKLLRLLIAVRLIQWLVARVRVPRRAWAQPRFQGARLEPEELYRVLGVGLLFTAVTLASWWPFVALGYDPLDALFEVTSAVGTVGLSSGITRPDLEPGLKLLLGVDMLLGRLEILGLLVLLLPSTWGLRRPVRAPSGGESG